MKKRYLTDSEVSKKVNDYGKKTKGPKFKCINPFAGRDSSGQRLVEIQCLESGEKLKHRFSEFYRFFPFQFSKYFIKKKINLIGLASNPKFICINHLVRFEKEKRYVKVRCLESNETRIISSLAIYQKIDPFYNSNYFIRKKINALGEKCIHRYICTNPLVKFYKNKRIVEVKCTESKEIAQVTHSFLSSGKDPFYKSNYFIEKEINEIGKNINPKFKCSNPFVGIFHKNRKIEIECIESKEKKVLFINSIRHKNFNPFKHSNYFIKKKINNIGSKSNPRYTCLDPRAKYIKQVRTVKIKNLKNNETCLVLASSLVEGKNPFNTGRAQLEILKIHPLYVKLFKKKGIKFQKKFRLGKKIIDFMFEINNKKYGLEIKRSNVEHSYSKKQISKYKSISKLKQYNLYKILVSDPEGRHKEKLGSISIKKLEKFIDKLLKYKKM